MEKGKKEKVKSLMLLFLFDLVPKLYLGTSGGEVQRLSGRTYTEGEGSPKL
jgi:hypothetical protein